MIADILLLLTLILLNGLFAMSEIAIVSSRRARLLQLAETSAGARHALSLASEPTRFLSSVQVGITSIGILNGAIGEASIASRVRGSLEQVPQLRRTRTRSHSASWWCCSRTSRSSSVNSCRSVSL
jgi:putative hemolysin